MFCPLSTMVSPSSRLLTFEEKHVRKLHCIPVYLESCTENISPTFDELQKHMFTKKPLYSAKYRDMYYYRDVHSFSHTKFY